MISIYHPKTTLTIAFPIDGTRAANIVNDDVHGVHLVSQMGHKYPACTGQLIISPLTLSLLCPLCLTKETGASDCKPRQIKESK